MIIISEKGVSLFDYFFLSYVSLPLSLSLKLDRLVIDIY